MRKRSKRRLKIIIISVVLASFFVWGVNILKQRLEDFFFLQQFITNDEIVSAQARQVEFEQRVRELKPIRDRSIADANIWSKSAISVFINNDGEKRVLFEKNSAKSFPIASLTKLMTANAILKNYTLAKEIKISKEAVDQEENFGKLSVGSVLTAKELLYPLLIESSNDAAFALANDYDNMDEREFVRLMNAEAQRMDLKNTHFVNPTGLDPEEDESEEQINYSSASDMARLTEMLLGVQLIWDILSTPSIVMYGQELTNTNKLLSEIPGIVGGKTGYTEKALGCFLLVLEAPKSKGYTINVILGTGDRFGEMEKLIEWTRKAYNW